MAPYITVRPSKLLPLRTRGRVEYVNMDNTYEIVLKGLSLDEARDMIERIRVEPEQLNTAPDAPPLPREFARRLEID